LFSPEVIGVVLPLFLATLISRLVNVDHPFFVSPPPFPPRRVGDIPPNRSALDPFHHLPNSASPFLFSIPLPARAGSALSRTFQNTYLTPPPSSCAPCITGIYAVTFLVKRTSFPLICCSPLQKCGSRSRPVRPFFLRVRTLDWVKLPFASRHYGFFFFFFLFWFGFFFLYLLGPHLWLCSSTLPVVLFRIP